MTRTSPVQALEHALTMTERERDAAMDRVAELEAEKTALREWLEERREEAGDENNIVCYSDAAWCAYNDVLVQMTELGRSQ